MSKNKSAILICLLLLIVMNISAADKLMINKDSLLNAFKNIPEKTKLQMLSDSAKKYLQGKKTKAYMELLLQEAQKAKSNYHKATAYFYFSEYYYMANADSMHNYMHLAEPLLLADNRKEEYFRMESWDIFILTNEGKSKQVLAAVNAIKQKARQMNYPEGSLMADLGLSNFYFRNGLEEEGIKLAEDILATMEAQKAPLHKRLNVLRLLITNTNNIPKRMHYLDLLAQYIHEMEQKKIDHLENNNSIDYLKFTYHRAYANISSAQHNAPKMFYHIQKCMKCSSKDDIVMKLLWVDYYELTKNYPKALSAVNELMDILYRMKRTKDYMIALNRKSNILYDSGNTKEAMDAFRTYTAMKDSISAVTYYNDVAKLRNQHDLDQLELKSKQMELKEERNHSQIRMLESSVLLLFVVCCAAIIIAIQRHRNSLAEKKARTKAEEADRLKSAFLANMNHEIRTPLNAIVGFSQVIVDEDNAENRKQYLNIIQHNNELLQQLIADVLDLSKIESNTMAFYYKDLELPSLMDDIYNTTHIRMKKDISLELESCAPYLFSTDRNRLTQIITNLLNNAIKHTSEGFIRFGYKIKDTQIYFFVKDSGEGIPENKLDTIFGRFVQLNEMSRGVGLGLAICKGLVTQMGGTIGVTSKLNEGSTFFFSLPIKKQ